MQIFTFFPEDLKLLIKEAIKDGLDRYNAECLKDHNRNSKDCNKEIYNVQEAAAYLSMAIPTLRKKYKKNIIKFIQEGRKITFRKEHLKEYLDKYTN